MYVKQETTNTIIIEKSHFITYLKTVHSQEEYKEYLKEIKKKHYDATHVCSAFICDDIKRSSDDGEPSGTAGVPILNVLDKKGLNNTCCLVVRYFGGIKLGAGGLIRAYSSSASEAINNAVLCIDKKYPKYRYTISYELANKLNSLLVKNALYLNIEYGEDVTIDFVLNDESIFKKMLEITKGIKPLYLEEETISEVVE